MMERDEKVGGYRILERLGAGAMGEVYRAAACRAPEKIVAIKLMKPELASDPTARRRFLLEIEIAMRLKHANVVTILDCGMHADRPYLVMEHVEGFDLAQLIERHKGRDLDQRVHIARQICQALSHAHDRGIVHRDIKPANIRVRSVSGMDQVKLLDFGIVQVDHATHDEETGGLGTFSYMSPEQLREEKLDRRSDLFSLGLVLYELFCGVHPFRGASRAVTIANILHVPPRRLAEQRPGLPEELSRMVMALLEKEPTDRPATADEVAGVLHRVLRDLQRRSLLGVAAAAPRQPGSSVGRGASFSCRSGSADAGPAGSRTAAAGSG